MFQKDLFNGNLGRYSKPSTNVLSPLLTVPQTREFPDETYEVLDFFFQGDRPVTCSLNGKMWVFKTVDEDGYDKYYVVFLYRNPETQKMESLGFIDVPRYQSYIYGGYKTNYPVARGIDWIMFHKQIWQVLDEDPWYAYGELIGIDADETLSTQYRWRYSFFRSLGRRTPVSDQPVGCSIDPFTLNRWGMDSPSAGDGNGNIYLNNNEMSAYPLDTKRIEACFSTALDVGGWILIEDFIIPKPQYWGNMYPNRYHDLLTQAKPMIPVDVNWYFESNANMAVYPTYGMGYSVSRRGMQVATFDGKLWVRGLMYMGQGFLIPSVINQDGNPEEFYLFCSNRQKCAGPYNQFHDPVLDPNTDWVNVTNVGLSDSQGETTGVLAGFLTEKADPTKAPICQNPATGDVLMPNAPDGTFYGTWQNPRPGDEGGQAYDYYSRIGLFLGATGCAFFGGDSATEQLHVFDNYDCANLSDWLAPAQQLEHIALDIVVSSHDEAMLVTMLKDYFQRLLLPKRFLPLAWGVYDRIGEDGVTVTEQVRDSYGIKKILVNDGTPRTQPQEYEQVTVTEIVSPVGTYKTEEYIEHDAVFKYPIKSRVLRFDDNSAQVMPYRVMWFTEYYALNERYYGIHPAVPSMIRSVNKGYVEFCFVNPETGEILPRTFNFGDDVTIKMFPIAADGSTEGPIGAQTDQGWKPYTDPLPDFLQDGSWRSYHQRYMESEPMPDKIPGSELYAYAWFMPAWGLWQGTTSQTPWIQAIPYGLCPYPDAKCPTALVFDETSSRLSFYQLDDRLGTSSLQTGSSGISRWNRGGLAANFYYQLFNYYETAELVTFCKDPVTRYDGGIKFLKNFSIWTTLSGQPIPLGRGYSSGNPAILGYWNGSYCMMTRQDLDTSEIDFDQELTWSKLYDEIVP